MRHVPTGRDQVEVLAAEVARLTRELADLRSTVLARAGDTVVPAPNGTAWRVTATNAGSLTTTLV